MDMMRFPVIPELILLELFPAAETLDLEEKPHRPARTERLRKSGFTLIELSVTIMILAVLVAFSIPTLQKARNSSNQTVCASNLRQIGVSLLTYAADNGGMFPPAENPTAQNQFKTWGYTIWTYAGYSLSNFKYPNNDLQGSGGADLNIFHCPTTKKYPASKISDIQAPNAKASSINRYSYALNDGPVNNSPTTSIRSAQLINPAATAMVLEQTENPSNQFVYHNFYGLLPHNRMCNVLFFDGHVALTAYDDIPPSSQSTSTFWKGQ